MVQARLPHVGYATLMTPLDVDTVLDWRGRTVVSADEEKLGSLDEVYLDEADRPAWCAVSSGLFGRRRTLVPLYEAEPLDDERVRVPYTRDRVEQAPAADPDVEVTGDDERRLARHYGIDDAGGDDEGMTRSEEEPVVTGKEMVPRERVRIRKVAVTDQVEKTVPVRREVVEVEEDPPPRD